MRAYADLIKEEALKREEMGDATPDAAVRTYTDVLKEEALKREKEETLRQIAKKKAEDVERKADDLSSAPTKAQGAAAAPAAPPAAPAAAAAAGVAPGGAAAAGSKRRNRWDVAGGGGAGAAEAEAKKPKAADWDAPDATPGPASFLRQTLFSSHPSPAPSCTPSPAQSLRRPTHPVPSPVQSSFLPLGATRTPNFFMAPCPNLTRSLPLPSPSPPPPFVPATSRWDAPTPGRGTAVDATPRPGPRRNRWDETPSHDGVMPDDATPSALPGGGGATPGLGGGATPAGMAWDATPKLSAGATLTPKKTRSRWDETPAGGGVTPAGGGGGATPSAAVGMTPSGMTPGGVTPGGATPGGFGVTPVGGMDMATPTPGQIALRGPLTPEQFTMLRWEREIEERNKPLSDEELDAMFPLDGYKVLDPPASYVPIRTPARKLLATPTPMGGASGGATQLYAIPEEDRQQLFDVGKEVPGLPNLKPEDYQYFDALLNEEEEKKMSAQEKTERKIMKLLLKVKNGTPPQRKTALRQLTDKAREFGASALFNQILPLLMSPTLEDQERHLLVKVIDRILYKLDELVRPFVHKILVVIEPLLIDEDYYARVEGQEIISNLSKPQAAGHAARHWQRGPAAGLATMIAAMRPDIDNVDEYVRNTTARAFSVVASALGIPALLPFLRAVCASKKSWQARHTGIKIVQQIAILMGCAVLPHLRSLVDIIEHGLGDDNQKVRTIMALSLAALPEASAPYGIESFDSVLKPLWKGIRSHRGKVLAAFLKEIGFVIPLMDAMYASYYTREVMVVLIREFQSPDKEMKKIVLKVVKQCVGTDGVEPDYIRAEILPRVFQALLVMILPEYCKHLWVRRMALDRRKYVQLVETTVEIANKAGVSDIIGHVVEDLKDESEPYRRMVMETVEKVLTNLGAADIDARLEELLIDGILYAFQEQTSDDANVMLNGFGTVVNALGQRVRPYLPQICGTICGTVKWRLNNKSAKVRQQAADLIARIAVVMKACGEEQLMGHLGVALYEYMGEGVWGGASSIAWGTWVSCSMSTSEKVSRCNVVWCSTVHWHVMHAARQQAADLIGRIAVVMKACGEEQLMGHLGVVLAVVMKACGGEQLMGDLGVVLYEYLGEEYPEVLGSILGALKAIVNVIDMTKMTPPIKDLLPRLTPILKNRHEKVQENCINLEGRIGDRPSEPFSLDSVQENCIDLMGRIADRGAEFVPAREWMCICFELLDMLKVCAGARGRGVLGRRIGENGCGTVREWMRICLELLDMLKVCARARGRGVLGRRIGENGCGTVREWMCICFELLDMLKVCARARGRGVLGKRIGENGCGTVREWIYASSCWTCSR
ncbi:unnamed protein product [Closterium sp. Naga37s-1]|nr:unnamed protein product [Closterium sp. Naga37s-1]